MVTTQTDDATAPLPVPQLTAQVNLLLDHTGVFEQMVDKDATTARITQKVDQLTATMTTGDGFNYADPRKVQDYRLQLVAAENVQAQQVAQQLLEDRRSLQQQLDAAITAQQELVDEVTAQAQRSGAAGLSNQERLLAQLLSVTQAQQAQTQIGRLSFPQLLQVYLDTPDHANRELVREIERQYRLGFPDVSTRKARPEANANAAAALAKAIQQRRLARVDGRLLQAHQQLAEQWRVKRDLYLRMLADGQVNVADHVEVVTIRA